MSSESWKDDVFGESAASCDGAAADTGKIIAIGAMNALEQSEISQSLDLTR